jgi:hypothetical protein
VRCLGPLSLRERVRVRVGGRKRFATFIHFSQALTPCPSPKGRGEFSDSHLQLLVFFL